MSVTAAAGFAASGLHCGIKADGLADLALVATGDGAPVAAAATFTRNRLVAAPVRVSRAHLAATGGRAAAVLLNSGCANAATGERGRRDAERTCALTADHLGCSPEEVLVASTGLIGPALPLGPIEAGIPGLVEGRERDGGHRAASAILTTDTRRKESVLKVGDVVVGGMAKGAAMLRPDMATMLAVVTTDADLGPDELHGALCGAVGRSFNRLTTDGAQSTNDTVFLLASGRAGRPDVGAFQQCLDDVCVDLATQMADDAEGATKVVRVAVTGAASDEQAERGARAVAECQLVKCSWYGEDPYWGRVASELGAAGIDFVPERVAVSYGPHRVARAGVDAEHDLEGLRDYMSGRYLEITADLGVGTGEGGVLTVDLTHGYVDENMGTS